MSSARTSYSSSVPKAKPLLVALSGAACFLASALTIGTFFPLAWGCGAFAIGGTVAGALGWRKGGLIFGPGIAGALLWDHTGSWIAYIVMAFLAYAPVVLYDDARVLLEKRRSESNSEGERTRSNE